MTVRRRSLRMSMAGVALLLLGARYAWPWGNDGHQIVARIAALNLTPKARRHVAQLLGVSSGPTSVANAMARAAVWPDTYLRNHAPKSKPWHFIDICRGADASNLDPFCPSGGCITKKIEEYRANIPKRQFDEFGGKGDLSLLIHFMGDIHQPLHCATNADRGGNCVTVELVQSQNLHSAWDTDLVKEVESGSTVEATAEQLNEDFQSNRSKDAFSWSSGTADDLARESHGL
ncbi:MAG TPA: S1/P1 nuclease, partial [Bryobacteraceae bacterium]|nr:S1/P1 nuclease [Bryobacteraceae bacterium]